MGMSPVSSADSLLDDDLINIDYNAMLYKTKKNKKKIVNFLICMDNEEKDDDFVWTQWCNIEENKEQNDSIDYAPKGHWQRVDNENYKHLNGILAMLHHKELRTQFDGYTMSTNPIKICFDSATYRVSWWNMSRMSGCNALCIDNVYYLRIKSPLSQKKSEDKLQWIWHDNDNQVHVNYDDSCCLQLECSYQANLESNFPIQIIDK